MSEAEKNLEVKHAGKNGTIIVEFFKTEQFERRATLPNRVHGKNYQEQQVAADTMKKNFSDSLCFRKGKEFSVGGGAGNHHGMGNLNHGGDHSGNRRF